MIHRTAEPAKKNRERVQLAQITGKTPSQVRAMFDADVDRQAADFALRGLPNCRTGA